MVRNLTNARHFLVTVPVVLDFVRRDQFIYEALIINRDNCENFARSVVPDNPRRFPDTSLQSPPDAFDVTRFALAIQFDLSVWLTGNC